MNSRNQGTLWGGLVLIGLGIAFLIAQWIGWDRIWPLFPTMAGLAFLGAYVLGGLREPGFVFVGIAATLVGLFFFGFSFGVWEWAQMGDLWPIFPIIGGLAFIALFVAERARDVGVLGVGCVAIVVGVVGLLVTAGLLGTDIIRLWPLLLVFVGLAALAGAILQGVRKE
ncbi:MAG TPA: hypothetical protein VLC95_09665 [Anaerolineae bacterium]|nr:hypothetical protein [Anaerolineae bacterium]